MNNDQFRRLLFVNDQASKPKGASPTGHSPTGDHASPKRGSSGGQTPAQATLGSRMRSSIPMTPRNLTAPNFAHQLAEYRRDGQNPHPSKKFKSSAAPKGTKLPAGYEDRAAARLRQSEEEERKSANEQKLKELEEKFKKGLIDEGTLARLRKELGFGGDLGSTHMVKGLDWDLLKKVRAGEDIEKVEKEETEVQGDRKSADEGEGKGEDEEVDVDEEFDKVLEDKADGALPSAPKEKEKKKGNMAAPPVPSQKKTRNEILRELKASRAAAASAEEKPQEPALGARFKKIGDSKAEKKRFIEQDENGRRREVLLITDAEGKTKKKTRWLDKPGTTAPPTASVAAPDKEAKPLGMEVPAEIAARNKAAQKEEEEEEDDDIFAGVGDDYNPLGDAGSDEDSSDSEEDGEVAAKAPQEPKKEATGEPTKPRNYFATTTTKEEESAESDRANPLTRDPTLLAALKRAASLRQAGAAEDNPEEEGVDKETLLRRRKFIEEAQRRGALDAMDMDMGFGGSRNDDDEDEEAVLVEPRGGTKRKRGPKKKKGDKDSASDVLRVMEGRKKS
ncbi:hypothetical protein ASPVEDRAFT_52990 [Aspergillus versicolor CBS 583.65]|uniref:RED-like N-terminal domain-containing protein n=1 Tax=Aspergillus versicolor CBS 583.65 TaxID=1036611 RepID=A0A1L9PLE5_ASPVE|nr:uncharacterized protein ASPVEDRAFT_52990 [Aspergillus versicolor CBS 583.65]OJJ02266.1 hypothetical protein ASPVEDRAFT_52990 [Aspergillus versicolor CBS 583.65]